MRILNEATNVAHESVTLYLTTSEAVELRDAIDSMLADPTRHHEHISSSDYMKEITVSIYDPDSLEQFDERSRRLIREDI